MNPKGLPHRQTMRGLLNRDANVRIKTLQASYDAQIATQTGS